MLRVKHRENRAALVAGLALAICLGNGGLTAHAQNGQVAYHTPKPGSAERKAIMDAMRVPVEKDLKMSVIFVVDHPEIFFRVVGDWAFVGATFRHPDGTPMGKDYYAKMGDVSDDAQALLHRVHGKWQVVTHVTAPTDVEWMEWPAKYHAPANVIAKESMTTSH